MNREQKEDSKKFTQKDIEHLFLTHGLIVKDTYINSHTPMHCSDGEGYDYMITVASILRSDKKGYRHCKFHAKNPFTIKNIQQYFKMNDFTCELLSTQYVNAGSKLTMRCECGSIFEASWSSVISGKKYCNFCSKSKRFDGMYDYTSAIREHCNAMGYTLLTQYIHRGKDKFDYVCNKHKEKGVQTSSYDQMITSHRGCWYCGRESIGISMRSDEKKFVEAVQRAGMIYVGVDYNNDGKRYKKANIHYLCPRHIEKGVQTTHYNNIVRSRGRCKYCAGRERTKDDMQKELDTLNRDADVLEYDRYDVPATFRCRICNSVWTTQPSYLIHGSRCPHCTRSNFEREVSNILTRWGYNFKEQYTFQNCRDKYPLPFDFYLPEFGVLIEADGEHHFIPVRRGSMNDSEAAMALEHTKFHDDIKTAFCKQNGLQLIRIPYWKRDELEYFLWDRFVENGIIEVIERQISA